MNIFKRYAVKAFPSLARLYVDLRTERLIKSYGFKNTVWGFGFTGHSAMQNGSFEQDETALLSSLLIDSDVFIDVGANIGFYCCLAKKANNHVIAFEPDAKNLNLLYKNLEINNWNDTEIYPLGLAETPGVAKLYGFGTGASLIPNWAGVPKSLYKNIALSTLDIILSDRFVGKKTVIKIDVEGFELSVLKGAMTTLATHPNLKFIIEICLTEHYPDGINPYFYDTFELFHKFGYIARTIEDNSKIVSLEDAKLWARTAKRTFGGINFLFERVAS